MNQGSPSPDLLSLSSALATHAPPDVRESWNPPFCGDIDMRIAADGTWFYNGSPIGRAELVRLFSSVLRFEDGRFFLVTPVEKLGIIVDDAPFTAVELRVEGEGMARLLSFRTNVGDWLPADDDHTMRFEAEPGTGGLKPYLRVRHDLWAKVSRALFYDLVAMGETQSLGGIDWFGLWSGGHFWAMAQQSELEGAME